MPEQMSPFKISIDRPAIRTESARRVFMLLITIAVILTAVRYYFKAEKPSRLGEQTRTAFLRWRPQIQGLESGINIYTAYNYPNPPIMALILIPFTMLPPLVGAMAWFGVKVGMAVGLVLWAVRAVASHRAPPDWALGGAILLAMHPLLGDLTHGNVNIFIAALVVLSMALFTRRWDFSAGLCLALAIACKVTPGLFLPYFVWKRAWIAVAGALVGLILWLLVVPGAVLGWDYNQSLLTSWFDTMVKPFVIEGKITSEHANQSIPGVVFRLTTAEPSFLDFDEDDRPVAAEFHNFLALSPDSARLIIKAFMVVFGLIVLVYCRYPTHRSTISRASPLLVAEFAIIMLGMLLLSERTWKHHATTLIVPFATLAWAATAIELPVGTRKFVRGAFVVVGLLMVVPSLLPEASQDLAMVYGAYTAAFTLTLATIVYVLAKSRCLLSTHDESQDAIAPERDHA